MMSELCFFVHTTTSSFDERTGIVYEPYFFMVIIGYLFLLISLIFYCVLVVMCFMHWLRQ